MDLQIKPGPGLTMCPAPGWYAVMSRPGEAGDLAVPIAMWAGIAKDNSFKVTGIVVGPDGRLKNVEDMPQFKSYNYIPEASRRTTSAEEMQS